MIRRRALLVVTTGVGLAAGAVWWYFRSPVDPSAPARPPAVVLVTIDTWRADRLSDDASPRLAALARQGLHFQTARSHAPLTLPSHISLMTGLLPPSHGVRENGRPLAASVPRLATWLRAAGYRTAAFVGAFVLDRRFGLAQGFDVYDDEIARDPRAPDRLEAERPAADVVDRALVWMRSQRAGELYFLWVHLYDPHAPYHPPAGVPPGRDPYDAEIRYTDAQVGRLLDQLALRADDEPTLVAIAGDHGESLGDHGERTHGMLLYESALRVPVILHGAGISPAIRRDPIGLVDLPPTILTLCGLPVPEGLDGVNLLTNPMPANREIYAETEYPRSAGWSSLAAMATDRWKVIRSSETELYDLAQDPDERVNRSTARDATAAGMLDRLAAVRARAKVVAPMSAVDPEVAERLRALGYVAAVGTEAPPPRSGANPARVIDGWAVLEGVLDRLSSGRSGDALADARNLAERFPDGEIFLATHARALRTAGRAAEALHVYRQAVTRFDTSASLLHDLAVAAREAGDPEEAVRAERAALVLDGRYAAAHNGLGLALTDLRRWKEAAAAFADAVRLDPRHAQFLVNLANARRDGSDLAAAEATYRQALDLDPVNADGANGLGTVLVATGRAEQAIPWFGRALESDPAFVGARLNLGIALQQAGRAAEAQAAYRAVLAAPPDFERERQAARELLEGLERARP
jgi:arylsulfatase A-like enzyme/Flp pilus assembly protein TadD